MTLESIKDAILGNLGAVFLLVFILWAGWKKYWVFGWYAKELLDRNDKMEKRLDRSVGAAESATKLAQQHTKGEVLSD